MYCFHFSNECPLHENDLFNLNDVYRSRNSGGVCIRLFFYLKH